MTMFNTLLKLFRIQDFRRKKQCRCEDRRPGYDAIGQKAGAGLDGCELTRCGNRFASGAGDFDAGNRQGLKLHARPPNLETRAGPAPVEGLQ